MESFLCELTSLPLISAMSGVSSVSEEPLLDWWAELDLEVLAVVFLRTTRLESAARHRRQVLIICNVIFLKKEICSGQNIYVLLFR
jgi:hypothetical protein